MKRLFDILISLIGLIILSPLFLIVALLIKCDSRGPVFFHQERIGKHFREFKIYKFRSMEAYFKDKGPQITVGGDKRITFVGRYLRRYKLDELPQLINVLKGDMSFVGPRPEVKKYVDIYRSDYERLLSVKPGITDPASLKYSNEETILTVSQNWEQDYISKILPEKIRLSMEYVNRNNNIFDDIVLILKTILKI